MYNESIISFPGLGIDEFVLDRVAFSFKIGGHSFTVMWYGIMICLAIFAGFSYFAYRAKQQGLTFDDSLDVALVTVIAAVAGARLYFVIFYGGYLETDGTFIENVLGTLYNVIAVWEGGLAIYGGIIVGALSVAFMARRKKVSFFTLGDMAVPAVMLGQSIGRWGNFCNGEAFGSETTLPWRMGLCNSETNFKTLYVHPTFFYESLWNIIGFIWINIFYRKRKYHGEVIVWYFSWYGLGRTFIELLRTDSLMIGSIRVSALLSALLVVLLLPIGIFLRYLCKKYTEKGLLQVGEIASVKMLLTTFVNEKKGNAPLTENKENHGATTSETTNIAEESAESEEK
jgi:phosphatidylglycerol:prolipoprotein diacylglycerol transferase